MLPATAPAVKRSLLGLSILKDKMFIVPFFSHISMIVVIAKAVSPVRRAF